LLDAHSQMILALVAYATYAINAGQFLWKFRLARKSQPDTTLSSELLETPS
jgi:3-vinyl bacteriochlorophyllide hydratase